VEEKEKEEVQEKIGKSMGVKKSFCVISGNVRGAAIIFTIISRVSDLLQCVAVCCSMLQCAAVCYSMLQCVAMPLLLQQFRRYLICCRVLQYGVVCCSVLQCVAVCCSVLQCVTVCYSVWRCHYFYNNFERIYTATHCNTLQLTTTHYTRSDAFEIIIDRNTYESIYRNPAT